MSGCPAARTGARPDGRERVGAASTDPGGPLVVVCTGHRCAALHRLVGPPDDELATVVRATRGGVLVHAGCVGACAAGAVAAVGARAPGTMRCATFVWLAGVQQPSRAAAVRAWVTTGGPGRAPVPAALAGAVLGASPSGC